MTAHNAYKYLRGIPAKNDRASSKRLDALLEGMELTEMRRRVFHVLCAGLNARHTAAMLNSILCVAGIGTVLLSFDAPYAPGSPEPALIDGRQPSNEVLVDAITKIRKCSLACEEASDPGRYEVLTAYGLELVRASDARVLVTDVSELPREALKLLPAASIVVLGALPADPTQLLRTVISRGTAETISTQQSAEVQRLITDRCADSGCRLTVAARRASPGGPEVTAASFAGFSFFYHAIKLQTSSVFVSSLACACASCDAVYALRRSGLEISEDAVVRGIRAASPVDHGAVVSIKPAVIAAALPRELKDAGADDMRRAALYSVLASDIAAFEAASRHGIRIFWLHGDALPEEFSAALAEKKVKVLSVLTADAGEAPAAAARRIAAEMAVKDEEIEDRDDSTMPHGVRSYVVIGTSEEMSISLPIVKQGLRRTLF